MKLLDSISWPLVLVFCATLGLAPFTPEPHIWEKIKMLMAGDLSQPIDIFDLIMHGFPWGILAAKGIRELTQIRSS